jgi:hypothetical protein
MPMIFIQALPPPAAPPPYILLLLLLLLLVDQVIKSVVVVVDDLSLHWMYCFCFWSITSSKVEIGTALAFTNVFVDCFVPVCFQHK